MSATTSISAPRLAVAIPETAPIRSATSLAPSVTAPHGRAPGPSPAVRIDPQLGILVLEFQDGRGKTTTLPTQRALAAYRLVGLPATSAEAAARAAAKAASTAPSGHGPTAAAAAPQAAPTAAAPSEAASEQGAAGAGGGRGLPPQPVTAAAPVVVAAAPVIPTPGIAAPNPAGSAPGSIASA